MSNIFIRPGKVEDSDTVFYIFERDLADFPVVLSYPESQVAAQGRTGFGCEVPMVNQVVVDYLLKRGFRMDSFVALMMNDKPFTRFENYILTSPPFFM